MDKISLFKDIILGISAIIGSVVAIIGLSTWRRQVIGKQKYEAVFSLLKSVYITRDRIRAARNPSIRSSEIRDASSRIGNSKYENNMDSFGKEEIIAVYELRWQRVIDSLIDLNSTQFNAEVLWGDKIIRLIEEYKKHIITLETVIKYYCNEIIRRDKGLENKIESIIYEDLDDQGVDRSEYGIKLGNLIKEMELFLRIQINN